MRIYVVRHQFAGHYSTDPRGERERELLPRSRIAALKVANELRDRGEQPTIVLASPYARTLQTADIFAKVLGVNCDAVDALGPHFSLCDWFLNSLLDQDDVRRPMIVGHHDNLNVLFRDEVGGRDWPDIAMGEVRRLKVKRKDADWKVVSRLLPSDVGEEDKYDSEAEYPPVHAGDVDPSDEQPYP